MFMIYDRGDVVILPFPFITTGGVQQKARPALVISDRHINRRFDDVILLGITSQRIDNINQTEFLIKEGTDEFIQFPKEIIARKLGKLPEDTMNKIDPILKLSLGLQ